MSSCKIGNFQHLQQPLRLGIWRCAKFAFWNYICKLLNFTLLIKTLSKFWYQTLSKFSVQLFMRNFQTKRHQTLCNICDLCHLTWTIHQNIFIYIFTKKKHVLDQNCMKKTCIETHSCHDISDEKVKSWVKSGEQEQRGGVRLGRPKMRGPGEKKLNQLQKWEKYRIWGK